MKEEYRMLMSTNDEGSIAHLTRIMSKPVDFLPGQYVTFACSGPKCYKVDGDFPQLSAQTGGILQEPVYHELWCARCGAIYLVTWGYKDVPTLVERRGWRDVESDGTWGKLHGQEAVSDDPLLRDYGRIAGGRPAVEIIRSILDNYSDSEPERDTP